MLPLWCRGVLAFQKKQRVPSLMTGELLRLEVMLPESWQPRYPSRKNWRNGQQVSSGAGQVLEVNTMTWWRSRYFFGE